MGGREWHVLHHIRIHLPPNIQKTVTRKPIRRQNAQPQNQGNTYYRTTLVL